MLFRNWLQIQDSSLTLPDILINNLDFPLEVAEADEVVHENSKLAQVPENALGLLKAYWNLAWFGGIHTLSQWTVPKGDSNFSSRLFLNPSELTLIKNSFSEAILDQLSVSLNKSKTHNDFQEGLDLAFSHSFLLQGNVEKKIWIDSLPWKDQFSRFMLLKPNTRNDEKLFLAIIEFLSKLTSVGFEPSDIKELIKEGKENLTMILTREHPDNGMDLFIRGHEKIGGLFLVQKNFDIDIDYFDGNRIWESELNVWSLKILSRMNKIGTPTMLDNNNTIISRLLRLITDQKTTGFINSGAIFQTLVILDKYCRHNTLALQFKDLNWIWKTLVHRDASIRVMGYQIASVLASSDQGAKLLVANDRQLEVWTKFIEVVLDRVESYQAKENAMNTLTNLLKLVSRSIIA